MNGAKPRNILEELGAMGILGGSIVDPEPRTSDEDLLGRVQESAKKVQEAAATLVSAATGIQEAVAAFSTVLAEAIEASPQPPADEAQGN